MTLMTLKRCLPFYCLLVGAGDALTGLMLMAAPLATLHLMGIATVSEPIFLRFIGAFVAGVGLSYGLPLLPATPMVRASRLASVLELTALLRLLVGTFVAIAVLTKALAPAWSTVAITDLALALVQIALLARAKVRHVP
jgi:hypothetical protein